MEMREGVREGGRERGRERKGRRDGSVLKVGMAAIGRQH